MVKACIAFDIGASGGRVIGGTLQDGSLTLQEVHRFKNSIVHIGKHDCWDINYIFDQIRNGLRKLKHMDIKPQSVGIDTWAVDYVLLDENDKKIAPVFSYRDHRTDNAMEEFLSRCDRWEVYRKTGIQFLQINTIYQLAAHMKEDVDAAHRTSCFLMVPDYLNYMLCHKKVVEYTNATSTQLFNINSCGWDTELIEAIGMRPEIFPEIIEAGTILGSINRPELIDIFSGTGQSEIKVIAPATHDTASAVVAVPAMTDDFAYISSGTWSLMGIESKMPICTEMAMKYNFTNEGGVSGTYRVLKNIMGMWLLQEVQKNYHNIYSIDDLICMAEESEPFKCLIDTDDIRFLNPPNMISEVRAFCYETSQYVPQTPGEIARCIFESLAFQYRRVLQEIIEIQDKQINRIHIIGGGSRNRLLNQLCASFTGLEVHAGPAEATAAGNLAMQFIALSQIGSICEAREIISNSFDIERYFPEPVKSIDENWDRFIRLATGCRNDPCV